MKQVEVRRFLQELRIGTIVKRDVTSSSVRIVSDDRLNTKILFFKVN